MYDPSLNPKKELAYDLRQAIAEIIGSILIEVTRASLKRAFPEWLQLLDRFHTEISMKLSDTEEKEYMAKWNDTIKTVLEHKAAFYGNSTEPAAVSLVYEKINGLEMWLRKIADKKDIFGSKSRTEGLS